MMRNITRICFALALAAFCVMSCHRELEITPAPEMPELEGDGIVLKLDVAGMEMNTRVDAGTRPGDNDGAFNENILGNAVDVFFFPEGATDNSRSTFSTSASVAASSTGGHLSIPVNAQRISTIFDGTVPGSKSLVYVVANYNGATSFDHEKGSYTLGELKSMPLAKANWATFPQSRFVMTGSSEITLIDASKTTPASGSIQMRRVAAKVTFKLTVADTVVVVNTTTDQSGNITNKELDKWTPKRDAMTVYLQYGMNYACLDGTPHSVPHNPKSQAASDSLYTYKPHKLADSRSKLTRNRTFVDGIVHHDPPQAGQEEWEVIEHHGTANVPLYKTMTEDLSTDGPFYTYPVTWEPGIQTEPFLKLIIPWNNGNHTKYYYYKVPFSVSELESNNWYEVTLDVQILGGEDEQPIPLTATYKIVDWVPGTTSEASVVNARYLSVPKTEWIMYNTEELTIPITSSHDVQIVGYEVKPAANSNNKYASGMAFSSGDKALETAWIGSDPRIYNPFSDNRFSINNTTTVGTVYATHPNYNARNMDGAPVPANITTAASWFPTAKINRDQIVFSHKLNNDMTTSNYDVAPYYIRIRVQHKDDTNYYKDIIIEQRPAIVIEAQRNSDMGYVNNSGFTTNNGYAWVNNVRTDQGTTGRNNTNFNMYIIETSVLPTSGTLKDFVLGDPREPNYTARPGDAGSNFFTQAATVDRGNNKRLAYYYPAGADESFDNFVAPKFRIASSFGASPTMSRNEAIRRCASYQEDGYPAGRWRLPTVAEIKFMAQLTSDNVIPRLLGDTGTGSTYYWCNSAAVRIDNAGRNEGVRDPEKVERSYDSNVRCVYDEWFWENTTYATVDRDTFKWGDQTRESVFRTRATE